MMIAIVILGALVVVAGFAYMIIRNSMIAERNRCDEAWSEIEVQLKRRHDLVPNLAEAVKGYASHERRIFERTATARAAAMSAGGPGQAAGAEQQLTAALADLRAVAEGYPQLRATENFQELSRSLNEIEGSIQGARDGYNADVRTYNTKIQIFPNSLVARQGGFTAREYFEIAYPEERKPATLGFDERS